MEKVELMPELLELFRQQGYEGVSIAHLSKATGLGKSSLYHHFPGGKEQMAKEVLDYVHAAVKQYFVSTLKAAGEPREKLSQMAKVVESFYEFGRKGCLIEGLTLGETSAPFQHQVAQSLEAWIDAIAEVGVEAGLNKKLAKERAESALIAIQGGLIVSRALRNYQVFKRVTKSLPSIVLDGHE
jgi:TetR/AcrR family transcriptional repressor of lmrAB and yxaGH operons